MLPLAILYFMVILSYVLGTPLRMQLHSSCHCRTTQTERIEELLNERDCIIEDTETNSLSDSLIGDGGGLPSSASVLSTEWCDI